jgi:hypothetical protein
MTFPQRGRKLPLWLGGMYLVRRDVRVVVAEALWSLPSHEVITSLRAVAYRLANAPPHVPGLNQMQVPG